LLAILAHAGCGTDAAQEAPLHIERIGHSPASFSANSYLIVGEEDAILVDAPEARSDADTLVAKIRALGVVPSRVFITHSHPDHFLAVDRIVDAFPEIEILSTAAVAERVNAIGPRMLNAMRESLGAESPDRFMPVQAVTGSRLNLDGQLIEIIGFEGGEDRIAAMLHVPARSALITGDVVYARAHLYLGGRDVTTWLDQLDHIETMDLDVLHPGHGPSTDKTAINKMREYLAFFLATVIETDDAADAIEAMRQRYPDYAAESLLEEFSVPAFMQSAE